jgi:hypothetical protein
MKLYVKPEDPAYESLMIIVKGKSISPLSLKKNRLCMMMEELGFFNLGRGIKNYTIEKYELLGYKTLVLYSKYEYEEK